MSNPRAYTIKRWVLELVKDRYPPHDVILERLGTVLVTDKDLKDFGGLLTDIYQSGYMKAVEDYRAQFEKHGVKIHVTTNQENDGFTSEATPAQK